MKFNFRKTNPRGAYESVPYSDWSNWQWQMRNSLKSLSDFSKVFDLSEAEIKGFSSSKDLFQIRSTPYYSCLASHSDTMDPIRRMQTPNIQETTCLYQEQKDPLGESANSVTQRLIHRYPDRVLFLVTDFCSMYCRFCTRKRFTGQSQAMAPEQEYQDSLNYIRSHPGIREVILSGGDALTLSDEKIERILTDLREIEHIEIIRIGSRMPVVNPFRITPNLVEILRRANPVYVMTHFNHPEELTQEASESLLKIADSGVPLFNQMVLLNGINNHAAIVQALSRRLLFLRVKPYYMFQCDPSEGTDHLRTSIENSQQIQRELWGNLSGLAMPNLSVDIPDGGGKAGLCPDFAISRDEKKWVFQGYDGVTSEYKNPEVVLNPDITRYKDEWDLLRNAKLNI